MSSRSRPAIIALIVILIIALPLLISIFSTRTSTLSAPPVPTLISLPATPTRGPVLPTIPNVIPSPTTRPTSDATATALALSAAATATGLAPTVVPTSACPIPGTPEPLIVFPITSPTDALSQNISVILGNGREIAISSEAGTVTLDGIFSAAAPAQLQVPLVPNSINNLAVSGKVEFAPNCFYVLQTRIDREGKPLIIVQTAATPAPTASPTSAQMYLKPFSQVFGVGEPQPAPQSDVYLYQGSTDPFLPLARDASGVRLQSADGSFNFWTAESNLANSPLPPQPFDYNVRGTPARFADAGLFACQSDSRPTLAFGKCSALGTPASATLVARVVANTGTLYLVDINGAQYWISATEVSPQ